MPSMTERNQPAPFGGLSIDFSGDTSVAAPATPAPLGGLSIAIAPDVATDLVELAFDPQTSGGLLVAVAPADADRVLDALRAAKTPAAVAIGHAEQHASGVWVTLR